MHLVCECIVCLCAAAAAVCVSFYRTDLITTFDVILMVFRRCMPSQRACLFFFVKMWIEWVHSSFLFYHPNICASLNGSICLCFIRFKACHDKSQTWCIYCLHVESVSAGQTCNGYTWGVFELWTFALKCIVLSSGNTFQRYQRAMKLEYSMHNSFIDL